MSVLDKTERENTELRVRVSQLEAEVAGLRETCGQLQREAARADTVVIEFNRNFSEFLEENIRNIDRKELVAFLSSRLCEKSEKIISKSREIDELKSQLAEVTSSKSKLEQKIEQLNSDHATEMLVMNVQLQDLQEELCAAKDRERKLVEENTLNPSYTASGTYGQELGRQAERDEITQLYVENQSVKARRLITKLRGDTIYKYFAKHPECGPVKELLMHIDDSLAEIGRVICQPPENFRD